MEIVLLIGLFVYLIITNGNLTTKLRNIEDQLSSLQKKFNTLKNNGLPESKAIEIPTPKTDVSPIAATETPNKPEEEIKPSFDIPPSKPIFEEKEEKVVFSMDNKYKPRVENKPTVPETSWWESFKEKNPDLEKFIGENLINKIGVLILVLGISYFVKYSIDKGWISEPARVGIGILSGALVLGIAHKLRQKYAAFSSVFVAGAIAIFYFTIGIAFHDYKLFGQTTAFIIMVLITAFSGFISLSYNRKELAILSLIGGFAVPFMVSTGQGNYVVLFTYILILDLGILLMAYFKKWNTITVLSYLFTVVLYGAWLFGDINEPKPHYLGALVFAFLFYTLFILIVIINNLRTKGTFTTIELTILASNTFLFYASGMVILNLYHPELKGLFTTILGFLNFAYAWFLYKKFGLDKIAVYLLIGLTLTFITLAIPVQFRGNYITLFWSAEAVLLLWLSQKSKIISYRFGSVIVSFLMLISLLMDWLVYSYTETVSLPIVFNKLCLTGIFAVLSLAAIRYLLKNETENVKQFGITFNPIAYKKTIGIIGVIVAYFVGFFEVSFQAERHIYSIDSAFSLTVFYHLLFSGIVFYFLCKTKTAFNYKIAIGIGLINIVLFTLWFSNYAFYEHEQYIRTGIYQRIAYVLHFLCLGIVSYFGYQIYKINKEKIVFDFFKSKSMYWIVAVFIVFMASKELQLHSMILSNSPVTGQDIVNNNPTDIEQINYESTSYKIIQDTRNQVTRTGFPILWGILAFAFLIIGIKKQNKLLRIIALALLGLTIVKLFVYDIQNASETGKIIAFILLGILILIISFVYQKIKVLVLDDNNSKNDE
jgi:hypothetical protein